MSKVLVVDDAAVDRRIAGRCVEHEDSTAVYAKDGHEALAVLERESIDAVLTDLQMPEMNGLQLVKEVCERYPQTPVILMTAWGSEETAVEALRAGAASYVPKKNLKEDLGEALRVVLATVRASRRRDQVREFLQVSVAYFVLGYEQSGPQALISYLQEGLAMLNFCGEADLTQVSTALVEALINARDHGNLELDSELRESGDDHYLETGRERAKQDKYRDRRVHVTARLTKSEAVFTIRDEGPGFDVSQLPDPTDPENLLKPSGRGILLIRTFMDEVRFNEKGNEITMIKRRGT